MRFIKKAYTALSFLLTISHVVYAQPSVSFVPCQEMPDIMQNYEADARALNRFYNPPAANEMRGGGGGATSLGGSSPEIKDRMNKLNSDYLGKLEKVSFNNLSLECKADYILFKRDLNEKLRLSALEVAEAKAVQEWFPFAGPVYELEKSRRRGIQPDAQQVAKTFSEINKLIEPLQNKLRVHQTLPVASVRKAGEIIAGLQKSLKSIFDFYNGYDPMFTWWVPQAYNELNKSLIAYDAVFNTKRPQPADKSGIIARKPVGRDEIIRLLNYEMIAYTPEEIVDIANKEFAWCDAEMLKASKELGFGNDWKAAVEKVKNSFVPPGQQPQAMLKLYNESVDFLKKHDLITIPPLAEETWGMKMMSPERQKTNAFFTGGADLTISYPTDAMSYDERMMSMRGNNPHFSRATVHHELIAGHNLEFFMNERYRTYRNFSTPFWGEGWSLYWELLLWDMDFPQGPEDRIGMLFWHMHRCARIIFSFEFHMGRWSPQQCIDFLVDRVGHERANAESEIRGPLSGNGNPLYQVAYLTGGRQFYALKKELVDSKKMTYKQFHDSVMKLNAMPVEMIRAILINQPLTTGYKTSWKFYDPAAIPK